MKRFDSPDDLDDRGLVNASYVILMSGQSQGWNATHANMSLQFNQAIKNTRSSLLFYYIKESDRYYYLRARVYNTDYIKLDRRVFCVSTIKFARFLLISWKGGFAFS